MSEKSSRQEKKKKKLLQKPHEMLKILRVLRSSWTKRAVQDKAKETSRTALRVGMWTTLLICNDNKQRESQNHPFFCWWCCFRVFVSAFFFFFFILGPHLWHMEVPRPGVLMLRLMPTPQPRSPWNRAATETYTIAFGNTGSLTHGARPGFKPTSPQRL